jgi:hypothetical protein
VVGGPDSNRRPTFPLLYRTELPPSREALARSPACATAAPRAPAGTRSPDRCGSPMWHRALTRLASRQSLMRARSVRCAHDANGGCASCARRTLRPSRKITGDSPPPPVPKHPGTAHLRCVLRGRRPQGDVHGPCCTDRCAASPLSSRIRTGASERDGNRGNPRWGSLANAQEKTPPGGGPEGVRAASGDRGDRSPVAGRSVDGGAAVAPVGAWETRGRHARIRATLLRGGEQIRWRCVRAVHGRVSLRKIAAVGEGCAPYARVFRNATHFLRLPKNIFRAPRCDGRDRDDRIAGRTAQASAGR